MSKFYGTVGDRWGNRGDATRCGHKSITAAAQSYDGSIMTELRYDHQADDETRDTLRVSICVADFSTSHMGEQIFDGTIDEYEKALRQYMNRKNAAARRKR